VSIAPAAAVELLNLPITTAVGPLTSQVFQIRPGPGGQWLPATMTIQANFTYGSGGTSTDAYLQTSLDGMNTWVDIAEFHFLVASARFIWTLESSLVAAPVQITTPTDGAMTANTALLRHCGVGSGGRRFPFSQEAPGGRRSPAGAASLANRRRTALPEVWIALAHAL
jgi:hypothetical protein